MALILIFVNTTNLTDISDYRYEVLIGDGTSERSKVLETGTFTGHRRSDGWEALIKRFLKSRKSTSSESLAK